MKRVQAIPALLMTVYLTGSVAGMAIFGGQAMAQTDDNNVPGQKNANHDVTIEGYMHRATHFPDLAAAYFTLTNKSKDAHLISGVSSPDCATVEAYHSEQEVTNRTANLFTHFTIPAETTMVFPVGGYHLICRKFPASIKTGDTVPMTFKFLGGTSTTVNFVLKD